VASASATIRDGSRYRSNFGFLGVVIGQLIEDRQVEEQRVHLGDGGIDGSGSAGIPHFANRRSRAKQVSLELKRWSTKSAWALIHRNVETPEDIRECKFIIQHSSHFNSRTFEALVPRPFGQTSPWKIQR
jgi:hypothetical protein